MNGTLPSPSPALDLAVRKARWRLLPFLLLMYLMAFLDRANVGFAKNVLQADVGIGDVAFAFGAGVFFVGYAIFEIPSGAMGDKFGYKRELTRILAAYERGEIDVLVNAQLLAEGWNSPRATVCMHLAPTASKRIYQQRVGRVTRRTRC